MECTRSIPTKCAQTSKRITKNSDILTKNKNVKAVIYGDAIPGSNFESLFNSMVSNQQNWNFVGVDEFSAHLKVSVSIKML